MDNLQCKTASFDMMWTPHVRYLSEGLTTSLCPPRLRELNLFGDTTETGTDGGQANYESIDMPGWVLEEVPAMFWISTID